MAEDHQINLDRVQEVKERVDNIFSDHYEVKPHYSYDDVIGLDLICKEGVITQTIIKWIPDNFGFTFRNCKWDNEDGQLIALFPFA